MNETVINDTVQDLPKLLTMAPSERLAWFKSLGTLEQRQLSQVAGLILGLHYGEVLASMAKLAADSMANLAANPPRAK